MWRHSFYWNTTPLYVWNAYVHAYLCINVCVNKNLFWETSSSLYVVCANMCVYAYVYVHHMYRSAWICACPQDFRLEIFICRSSFWKLLFARSSFLEASSCLMPLFQIFWTFCLGGRGSFVKHSMRGIVVGNYCFVGVRFLKLLFATGYAHVRVNVCAYIIYVHLHMFPYMHT